MVRSFHSPNTFGNFHYNQRLQYGSFASSLPNSLFYLGLTTNPTIPQFNLGLWRLSLVPSPLTGTSTIIKCFTKIWKLLWKQIYQWKTTKPEEPFLPLEAWVMVVLPMWITLAWMWALIAEWEWVDEHEIRWRRLECTWFLLLKAPTPLRLSLFLLSWML